MSPSVQRMSSAERAAPPSAGRALSSAQQAAVAELLRVAPVAEALAERFVAAGHQLHLVGGSVRDALLGRLGDDLDFTTDARPEQILRLVQGWAQATWTTGIRFGTIGAQRNGLRLEITTYRSDSYDGTSRNPEVVFGDTLPGDLVRRDFTVNAMAVALPERTFTDPYGGLSDLAQGVLRTPGAPEVSFGDDPLRMLRACRFAAQLGFTVDPAVELELTQMAEQISRISAERVRDELSKLLCADVPRPGLELLTDSGLAAYVLPELPAMRMEIDEHHQHKDVYQHSLTVLQQAIDLEQADPDSAHPDLVLRLAALLHDVGKPRTRRKEAGGKVSFHHHEVVGAKMTRARLRTLRYPSDVIQQVYQLVFLHLRFHGYGGGEWTDSAVRRYVTDAGDQVARLHKLVRSDSTTRNQRRAATLAASYDSLEARIAVLREQEELSAIRPDLTGNDIMELLGIEPGPIVGQAYRFLYQLRLDRGPLPHDEAVAELRAWAAEHDL